jgi:hypothetical protein
MDVFSGYHSEWNLGSPGGWDYQRTTQEIGEVCWNRIRDRSGLDLDLDFAHPLLNPMPGFLQMILRAHRLRHGSREAFVLVVAEEETLDSVVENQNLAKSLNAMEGVRSVICAPQEAEFSGDAVRYRGDEVTTIFMDFNTDTLLDIHRQNDCTGLIEAVRRGILVNPRGMEAINTKAIFEVVQGPLRDKLNPTTVDRTPWTRYFLPRSTTGPDGSAVQDLVAWTRANQDSLVLKPAHGYSGHGVFVGPLRDAWDDDVETALQHGDYIVQKFVPLEIWTEEQPRMERDKRRVSVRKWQTDFRCLITDEGLIGFVGRFGGVPTNVGSGGGVQPLAVLRSPIPMRDAVQRINDATCGLVYEVVEEIRDEMNRSAEQAGLTYLLGPIMTALRPRLVLEEQLDALQVYSRNLWEDCRILEKIWREGGLRDILHDTPEAQEIYRLQPWQGSPSVIASDGLFGFGAQV